MGSKDIFPLGCYDHKFSDPSNFPLWFFATSCAQSHLTTLLIKHIDQFEEPRESWESDCHSPCSDICPPFFMRTCVFMRIPNMINYIFSM
jgi:hypothetical protein